MVSLFQKSFQSVRLYPIFNGYLNIINYNTISRADMAKLLKCSQQTYSRYESHTTEIPLQSLIFLAEYYDTSVDYLLGIAYQQEPYPR